jgi:FkbM family methyltransferase
MTLKSCAFRFVPKPILVELRHRKHLHDLAAASEPEEAEVRKVLHPGQTALDIGANYGVFTKLFSELVGDLGTVIAFEPVPQTFRTLAAGIDRFHLRNVQARNSAVSDQVGTTFMTIPLDAESNTENLYQSHIVASPGTESSFAVSTLTVDSLQLPRVDFIKVDVEGHELEVLRGSRETLARHHPTLMVEVTSSRTVEFLCDEMNYQQPFIASPSNSIFRFADQSARLLKMEVLTESDNA